SAASPHRGADPCLRPRPRACPPAGAAADREGLSPTAHLPLFGAGEGRYPSPLTAIRHLSKFICIQMNFHVAVMSNFLRGRVLEVRHWTEALFSFSTTRDPSFRFANGQFTMIGLEVEGRPLLRAYSLASANHEDRLEFFSIKVPDGP